MIIDVHIPSRYFSGKAKLKTFYINEQSVGNKVLDIDFDGTYSWPVPEHRVKWNCVFEWNWSEEERGNINSQKAEMMTKKEKRKRESVDLQTDKLAKWRSISFGILRGVYMDFDEYIQALKKQNIPLINRYSELFLSKVNPKELIDRIKRFRSLDMVSMSDEDLASEIENILIYNNVMWLSLLFS